MTAPTINLRSALLPLAAAAVLGGCAIHDPQFEAEWNRAGAGGAQASSKPPVIGRYKLGAPYEAAGLWYVPAVDARYNETGVASWYGMDFDGKSTANGERFDINVASAAHPTLPLPSLVEVTNLENGKKLRVRLNDRGPFKPGRIVDLSPAAARELGFFDKGSAKVKVRYVGPASLDPRDPRPLTANSDMTPPIFPGTKPELPASAPAAPSAPLAPPVIAAAPSAPVRTAPLGEGFVVQAGAFSDRTRADRVAAAVSKAGPAEIRPLERDGGTLYRVVIGYWQDPEAARAARETVAGLGYPEAKVTKAF